MLHVALPIVAAISPRLVWECNAPWAERIARAIAEDPEIDLTAEEHDRIRIDTPVGPTPLSAMTPEQAAFAILALAKREGMRIPVPTRQADLSLVSTPLPKELAKAVRIARGEPVNEVLSGHKVRSFFNNMMDPGNTSGGASVTIDTHAVSAALGVAGLIRSFGVPPTGHAPTLLSKLYSPPTISPRETPRKRELHSWVARGSCSR